MIRLEVFLLLFLIWPSLSKATPCEESLLLNTAKIVDLIYQKKAPSERTWTCATGSCAPFSRQMQYALHTKGIEMHRIRTSIKVEILLKNGTQKEFNALHYFLVSKVTYPLHNDVILVDPTYRQFLGKKLLGNSQDVFVGTREDLIQVFSQSAEKIFTIFNEVFEKKNVEPSDIVDSIYGYRPESKMYEVDAKGDLTPLHPLEQKNP